jgi:hypothetical protein
MLIFFTFFFGNTSSIKKKRGGCPPLLCLFCSGAALESEPQADFEDSGSVSFFDVAVGAVSFECRVVRVAVIQIAAGIRVDNVPTSAEKVEDIEIGAYGESLSEAESLLQSHVECGDRSAAPQPVLFGRNIGIGITGVFVLGIIRDVDIDRSLQARPCREQIEGTGTVVEIAAEDEVVG